MPILTPKSRIHPRVILLSAAFLLQFFSPANAQSISTPCSASMISTFTPCLNYITGSSFNGSSPTSECCSSLQELVSASMDCACLVITANVPLPFSGVVNQGLALALPRFCKGAGVPIQCKATGTPLPAPGPVLFAPPPPPSAFPPQGPSAAPEPAPGSGSQPLAAPPVGVGAPSKSRSYVSRSVLAVSGSGPSKPFTSPALMLILVALKLL